MCWQHIKNKVKRRHEKCSGYTRLAMSYTYYRDVLKLSRDLLIEYKAVYAYHDWVRGVIFQGYHDLMFKAKLEKL